MPGSSPSVLIIRLDAIGDALALTPLLAAFAQRAIPVDLVLRPANADVFSSRAARQIIASNVTLRSSDRSNLQRIESLGAELHTRAYSHVLVATEDPGGYRLAKAVGAPTRVGFANGWGKPFKTLWARMLLTGLVYRSAGLDPRAPHEAEVLFTLGRSLLGDAAPTREVAALRPLVLESEPPEDKRVAVQISDKWARLNIGFDRVTELVQRLGARVPLRLISAHAEREYAREIANAVEIDVECFSDIATWKAAIAAAPALVAPDSGALHVAGMVGTPTVAVFPPTRDAALQTARWAPWAAPFRLVQAGDEWPARAVDALEALLNR
jgi:ADP-heptose:LPS heptosyltransferase